MEMYPGVRIKFTLNGEEAEGTVKGIFVHSRIAGRHWVVALGVHYYRQGEWSCVVIPEKSIKAVLPPPSETDNWMVESEKRMKDILREKPCTVESLAEVSKFPPRMVKDLIEDWIKFLSTGVVKIQEGGISLYYIPGEVMGEKKENNNPILGGELAEDQ